ncbi:hypothetical protein Tco_0021498, partial [Tanacetum coccineum]
AFLRRSQESTVPGGSLSTHRLTAPVRVMGKTMSTTQSTCSWASSFLFPKKVQPRPMSGSLKSMLDTAPW